MTLALICTLCGDNQRSFMGTPQVHIQCFMKWCNVLESLSRGQMLKSKLCSGKQHRPNLQDSKLWWAMEEDITTGLLVSIFLLWKMTEEHCKYPKLNLIIFIYSDASSNRSNPDENESLILWPVFYSVLLVI